MEHELVLPVPYEPITGMVKMMDQLNRSGEVLSNFIGIQQVESLFYIYLLKKYKNRCFLFKPPNYLNILINLTTVRVSKDQLMLFNNIALQICKCIKQDMEIIIIPFSLIFRGDKVKGEHANVMIYRKRTNQIEHFEPHGGSFLGYTVRKREYNDRIQSRLTFFTSLINVCLAPTHPPVTFMHSSEVCIMTEFNKTGFQTLEERSSIGKIMNMEGDGYCLAWSMFFTELCLKNPLLTSKEILELIDDHFKKTYLVTAQHNLKDYLRKVIRGYANFINEKIMKYFSIFFGEELTIAKIQRLFELKSKGKLALVKINDIITDLIELDNKEFDSTLTTLERYVKIINEMILKNHDDILLADRIVILTHLMDKGNKLIENRLKYIQQQTEKQLKYKDFKVLTPLSHDKEQEQEQCSTKKCGKIYEIFKEIHVEKALEQAVEKDIVRGKICPPGKVLNPVTNRCIKNKTIKQPVIKACPPGKVLNPVTNRCIKNKTIKQPVIKACPPGKVLNPSTNRCIKNKTIL
jgi:hypothetical protein